MVVVVEEEEEEEEMLRIRAGRGVAAARVRPPPGGPRQLGASQHECRPQQQQQQQQQALQPEPQPASIQPLPDWAAPRPPARPHPPPAPPARPLSRPPAHTNLLRGGFQPRLPTSLPPPGQQQQPSPLPHRQPVPLMPPAQLHPGAPQVVAPAPAVPLQSPPPSELMDVDPSAGPPSQAVAVQPVLQPLSLGTPKESDTAAPCPAPTQQPSTQRQETLPLFVGPVAPSRPVPEAANAAPPTECEYPAPSPSYAKRQTCPLRAKRWRQLGS
ncbi:proline-rich protein 2-like [Schistocerca americana]|uniref:proline-rich protein 2-like n=1 Tax=Schistocerca americana TaxID=7009 RepID=UPI001F503DFA|nr:proline-rich protein 2-like [Schistocerca americana]